MDFISTLTGTVNAGWMAYPALMAVGAIATGVVLGVLFGR